MLGEFLWHLSQFWIPKVTSVPYSPLGLHTGLCRGDEDRCELSSCHCMGTRGPGVSAAGTDITGTPLPWDTGLPHTQLAGSSTLVPYITIGLYLNYMCILLGLLETSDCFPVMLHVWRNSGPCVQEGSLRSLESQTHVSPSHDQQPRQPGM